jgi:Tropinone reductase 1
MMTFSLKSIVIFCLVTLCVSKKWDLSNKNIIVTGGSEGIGKSIVDELLSLGAKVLTCGRNEDKLSSCLNEWEEEGFKDQVFVCTADVSTAEGRLELISRCSDIFGDDLHCLVNNVGSNIRYMDHIDLHKYIYIHLYI